MYEWMTTLAMEWGGEGRRPTPTSTSSMGWMIAIVPWNYPFHNVFNPVSTASFSGNSNVIKARKCVIWSIAYYKRLIGACLDAIGDPRDLVQHDIGYGPTATTW